MSKSITEVSANNTFQTWLDKTNELVQLVNSDIVTASPTGDTTVGDATLVGSFTANTVVANDILRVDTLNSKIGSTSLAINTPVNISTNVTVLERLTSVIGPRLSFFDTTLDWQVGFENNVDKNFVISSGSSATFRLNSAGNLTITGSITAPSFVGNLTGNVIGNLSGDVTGSVSSLSNHNTNSLAEGPTNLFFTTARARSSLSQGTGIAYNSTTGVIAVSSDVVLTSTNQTIAGTKTFSSTIVGSINGNAATATQTSATATGTNSAELVRGSMGNTDEFRILIGATATDAGFAEIATGDNGNEPIYVRQYSGGGFTTLTRSATLLDGSGNTSFPGSVTAAGNVTAYSDERLKSNIRTIDRALEKVTNMRGVYFDKDGEAGLGVIAQEIEKVIPEAVLDGEYKSVAYGNLVGVLIEAVKELKLQVDSLKS